eukprot:TRINITY_DN52631_c0_g1_i2.p1 TRINITY_DN52631_c0_g1~~TRINITY_DN52631_c0_g1_i2.p1  ORF type:complete len:949 (+),score=285.11 TRINITY_DN52631_c0_g1_i2:111-2849(+)
MAALEAAAEAAATPGNAKPCKPAFPEEAVERLFLALPLASTLTTASSTYIDAGHRLWRLASTSHGGAEGEHEALLSGRHKALASEIACLTVEAGLSKSEEGGDEEGQFEAALDGRSSHRFNIILQWVLTAKAWLDAASDAGEAAAAALRCLERSDDARRSYEKERRTHSEPLGEGDRAKRARRAAGDEATSLEELELQTTLLAASAHSRCGSMEKARALLEKALGLIEQLSEDRRRERRTEHADVLRQLAAMEMSKKNHVAAEAHLRAVVTLVLPDTAEHAKALQELLQVLCAAGVAESLGVSMDDLRCFALQFVRHRHAGVLDCLCICRSLAENGQSSIALECLQQLRRREAGGDKGRAAESISEELQAGRLLEAHLLANNVEESTEAADDPAASRASDAAEDATAALCDFLHNVEDAVTSESGNTATAAGDISAAAATAGGALFESLSVLLWGLSKSLAAKGRHAAAAYWLERALPFMPDAGSRAAVWRALAWCQTVLGERTQARRSAETGLASGQADVYAATLLLRQVLAKAEASAGQRVLKRLAAHEKELDLCQMAYIVLDDAEAGAHSQAASSQGSGAADAGDCDADRATVLLRSILDQLLAEVCRNPAAAARFGVTKAWLWRGILEAAEACATSSAELSQLLNEALEHVQADAAAGQAENGWFVDFALRLAGQLAQEGRLVDSVVFLEARLAAAASEKDADGAAAQEGVHSTQTGFSQAALQWAEAGIAELEAASRTASASSECAAQVRQQMQRLLWLQFEALCLCHAASPSAADGEKLTAVIHLATTTVAADGSGKAVADEAAAINLAKLASELGSKVAAAKCLARYAACLVGPASAQDLGSSRRKSDMRKRLLAVERELMNMAADESEQDAAETPKKADDPLVAAACQEALARVQALHERARLQ